MTFDILQHVTILEPTSDPQERSEYIDEHYRPGFIPYQLRISDRDICIIEVEKVYPVILSLLREWLADGVITDDEMDDVVLHQHTNERLRREYIVECIENETWTIEWVREWSGLPESATDDECIDAYHQRRLRENKQQTHDSFKTDFNRLYKIVGDALWALFDKPTNQITSQIERNVKYNALLLIERLINRAITAKLGGISTTFYLPGDGAERLSSVWRVSPRKHL